jgi:plasmid stabilization system protein ParE
VPKLKYSERALEDLDAIYAYIAIDGVSRADSILNREARFAARDPDGR